MRLRTLTLHLERSRSLTSGQISKTIVSCQWMLWYVQCLTNISEQDPGDSWVEPGNNLYGK